MKSLLFILFFTAFFYFTHASLPEVKLKNGPFWQGKQKLLERISDQREILVNVKALESENIVKTLEMQGVGVVNSSSEESFTVAKNFKNLEKVSDHIKKIEFDEAKRQLYMHSEAFNYYAKMWMNIDLLDGEEKKEIRFLVAKGVFSGMNGSIRFYNFQKVKSRIELLATYNYEKLPIPTFFIEFGLEVVMQKIAAKMRSFIEQQKTKEAL